jgi:hypothetical protein
MTATGNLIYTVLVASGLVGASMIHTVPMIPRPGLERYYTVESVTAERVDGNVILHVDRKIHAPITMSYVVRVFQMTESGAEQVCVAPVPPFRYRTDAILPDLVTLDWWTSGMCPNAPTGRVQIDTTWTPVLPSYPPITVTTEVAP